MQETKNGQRDGKEKDEPISVDEVRWRYLRDTAGGSGWATREGAAHLVRAGKRELERVLAEAVVGKWA